VGSKGNFQPGVQIAEFDCGGEKIAVLGICFRNEKYAFGGGSGKEELLSTIKLLADENKLVVVSVHWGDELMDCPAGWQREVGREFIDAGASIIAGHHPHVIQGIENYSGGLIAYSLGNFIFDSFLEDTRWGAVLSVTLSGKKITGREILPIVRDDNHRPSFAEGDRKEALDAEILRRNDLLKDGAFRQAQDNYQLQFNMRDDQARRKLKMQLLGKMWSFKPVYWHQFLYRPIQRRLGLW